MLQFYSFFSPLQKFNRQTNWKNYSQKKFRFFCLKNLINTFYLKLTFASDKVKQLIPSSTITNYHFTCAQILTFSLWQPHYICKKSIKWKTFFSPPRKIYRMKRQICNKIVFPLCVGKKNVCFWKNADSIVKLLQTKLKCFLILFTDWHCINKLENWM